MALVDELTGQRFGKLTVIGRYTNNGRGQARWECLCQCGKKSHPTTNALKSGNSRSCGCTRVEKLNDFSTKHRGKRRENKERLYGVWQNMLSRCYNENVNEYENYGGRGISVCDEWRESYAAFRDWALSNGYNSNARKGECTIDRMDNDGDYSPNNCTWVAMKRQANNKRNNHILFVNGEKITAAEASEKYMIPYRRLLSRLNRGWTDEEAVLTGKRVNQWG